MNARITAERDGKTLTALAAELRQTLAAKKCWRCGCFLDTVTALRGLVPIATPLGALLDEAQRLFEERRYDCLGCETCWPAVTMNLAAEIDPAVAEQAHCATEEPEIREGWPPLPGDYRVLRFQAPVAVCTLNSDVLAEALAGRRPEGLAITGGLHTENLGIEHLMRNVLANPHIRFLIVCGEDTRRAIGHLPGQSLLSLLENGVDEKGRIIGARGKRPLLKNVSTAQIAAFRTQVTALDHIGENDTDVLCGLITATAAHNPGPVEDSAVEVLPVAVEEVAGPARLRLDPTGYFVVYPDRARGRLMLEHYSNQGVLDRVFAATAPAALYAAVIEAGLISRLDHAAYLGRELARAEAALATGAAYVQGRAAGTLAADSGCGCTSADEMPDGSLG